MIKLLILLGIGYLLWRSATGRRPRSQQRGSVDETRMQAVADEMVEDPVCGVYVARSSAVHVDTGGRRYYFCSDACREAFRPAAEDRGDSIREENS